MTIDKKVHILRHALGINDDGHGNEYRNYFTSGPDCDNFAMLREMVAAGLMVERSSDMLGSLSVFHCTENGKELARRDVVPAQKLTRSQKRYRAFLASPTAAPFGDWLRGLS